MYVCICNSVTDKAIEQAAREGAETLQDLQNSLKVATCCGRCANCAKDVLQEAKAAQSKASVANIPVVIEPELAIA